MRIIAHDLDKFQHVYGADSFLHYFPEITTMGVPIILVNGNYYIHKDGKPVDKVHSFSSKYLLLCTRRARVCNSS